LPPDPEGPGFAVVSTSIIGRPAPHVRSVAV
jgi:hypothetical protein